MAHVCDSYDYYFHRMALLQMLLVGLVMPALAAGLMVWGPDRVLGPVGRGAPRGRCPAPLEPGAQCDWRGADSRGC